jgi:hypothetical protein
MGFGLEIVHCHFAPLFCGSAQQDNMLTDVDDSIANSELAAADASDIEVDGGDDWETEDQIVGLSDRDPEVAAQSKLQAEDSIRMSAYPHRTCCINLLSWVALPSITSTTSCFRLTFPIRESGWGVQLLYRLLRARSNARAVLFEWLCLQRFYRDKARSATCGAGQR